MLLVPGVYRLFADISFTGSATMRAHQERQQDHDVHAHDEMKRDSIATAATADTEAESAYLSRCIPYEHVKMMCVPRDLYEAPWLDEAVVRKYRNRRHVFHGLAGDGWTTTGRRLSISAGADKGASSNNISSKSAAVTAVSGSRKSLMRRGSSNHGSEGNKSQQDLDGQTVASQGSLTSLQYLEHKIFPRQQAMQDVADDATTLPPLEHMIWLEVSSFDKVMLTPGMGAGGGVVGESAMDDDEYVTRLYEEEDEERVYRAARGQSAQDAPTRPAAPIPLAAPSGSLEQISEAASSAVSASVSASATATGTSTTTGTGTATQPAPTMIASTAVASILEGDEGSVQSASIAEDSAATMPKPIIELTHRLDMDVLDSTWPFMSESQTEAASSYLVDQLTAQREAAEDLATQFVDLASRVNSLKKAVIVRQRQSTLRPNL